MKKKIIISSNTCWNIYNFRFKLIKKILDENYIVYILANIDKSSLKLKEIGCEVLPLSFSRKKKSILELIYLFYKFLYYFLKIKPDLYFSFTLKPNLIGGLCANILNIKSIINFTGLGTLILNNNIVNRIIIKFLQFSLKKSSCVFFHNENDLKIFKNNNNKNKINYNIIQGSGVDLEKFNFYSLNNDKNLVFLFIGRFIKDKGIIEFIKAANILKKNYNNISFLAIGDYDYDNISGIKEKDILDINKLNNVEIIGFQDNILNYLIRASCVVLPSYREGMSKSLLEACSVGRPIIASNVPGCKEIVKENHNGFLCDARDHKNLADKIEKFINLNFDEKKLFGKRSRDIAEKKFDEKLVISRYMDEINKYV